MDQLFYEQRIPKSRIAVLIGKAGETKNHVEDITKSKLDIDSETGDVIYKYPKPAVSQIRKKGILKDLEGGF